MDVEAIVQQVRKENERDLENVRRQLRESREEAKMFKVKAERMEAESNSDPDALPAQVSGKGREGTRHVRLVAAGLPVDRGV